MANQVLYGFHQLKDVVGELVTTVGVEKVESAARLALAEHERQLDAFLSLFVTRTTDFKSTFMGGVTTRNQPLDENGRAIPIKGVSSYDLSWPIHMSGNAYGWNYVTGQKATVGQFQRTLEGILLGDAKWMRDHIFAALYANVAWTFVDPIRGSLTIQGLANADAVTYQILGGADAGATDQHYYAQAADIADAANPFPTIYDELTEHPENSGEVIVLVPSGLIASVEALTNFREINDPRIRVGANTDVLVGTLGVATPGVVRGYVDGCWVVEWRSMPANYMIAVTADGERPLAMREDEEASLRGFGFVADRNNYPWYERQYMRRAGFGAWNRVGALVYRIGDAAYAIPTGYTNPMP